jgi:Fe-S cluster assembly iron-binding protein IscA
LAPSLIEAAEERLRMITVTEAAKEHFRAIRHAAACDGEVMRLDRAEATANGDEPALGISLVGEPEENDQLVEHRGEPLLWVSVAVSAAYDGCVVDVVETSDGIGFAIGPPEAGGNARS